MEKIFNEANKDTKITNKKVANELHANYLICKKVETYSKRNVEKTLNYENYRIHLNIN